MKILNWMNRKFGSKDGKSVKRDEFISKETDKKPLIDSLGLVDVIDVSWRDGLLTIGTLGYDQLQKLIPEEEYFHYLFPDQNGEESENDDDDDDDEYLAEEFFENNNQVDEEYLNSVLQAETQLLSDLAKDGRIETIGGKTLQPPTRNEHILGCGFKCEEKRFNDGKKKKVTLAELFSAETDEEKKGHNEKTKLSNKCTSGHKKHGLSSVKKIIPRIARVDSRLAHKLNQMVTRVLKRKIHPDPVSQGKHQKERHNQTSIFGHQLSVQHSINETVSLLPARDAEI